MVQVSALLLSLFAVVCVTTKAVAASSPYNVIARESHHHRRHLQNQPTSTPTYMSFDGDLDRIYQLALSKATEDAFNGAQVSPSLSPSVSSSSAPSAATTSDAPSLTPSFSTPSTNIPTVTDETSSSGGSGSSSPPSDAPSLVPSSVPSSTGGFVGQDVITSPTLTPKPSPHPALDNNKCPDAILNRMLLHEYKYTMETVAGVADIDQVIGEVEEMLQEALVPMVLQCYNEMAASLTIVAIDSTIPRDEVAEDAVCTPEDDAHDCTVVDGMMRIFISDPGRYEEALEFVAIAVQEVFSMPSFLNSVGTGLVKIDLVDDPVEDAIRENDIGGDESNNDNEFNGQEPRVRTRQMLLLASGSAAIIAFVGSFYYWKRGNENDGTATEVDGTATMAENRSPFSQMLPRAYRFNDSMSVQSLSILHGQGGMSPVMECETGSSEQNTSTPPGIAFSTSGFSSEITENEDTTAASFDLPKTLYAKPVESPIILGARKRDGGNETAGVHLTESGSIISEVSSLESSPGQGRRMPQSLLDDTDAANMSSDQRHADESLLLDHSEPMASMTQLVVDDDMEEIRLDEDPSPMDENENTVGASSPPPPPNNNDDMV